MTETVTSNIRLDQMDIADRVWDDGWYHGGGVAFRLDRVVSVEPIGADGCTVGLSTGETFDVAEDWEEMAHVARFYQAT